jgi:hypothetical protein
MTSCVQISVCDTGCMSAAISPAAAYKVGLKKKDFIPVVSRMNGAGRGDLGVIREVVMQFHMVTEAGQMVRTKQLGYMCTNVDKIYMSRQGLQQLGIIGQNSPLPDNQFQTKSQGATVGAPPDHPPQPYQPHFQAT